MKYLVPVVIAAATLVAAAAGASAPATGAATVAAVFPPWWSRERALGAVAGTDGSVLREGAVGSILLVRSEIPMLADRLRSRGALLVLGPAGLAGCLFSRSP